MAFTHKQTISQKGEAYTNASLHTAEITFFSSLSSWMVPRSNTQESTLIVNQYIIWTLRGQTGETGLSLYFSCKKKP